MIMMQTRTVKIVELHNPMYRYLEIKGGFFFNAVSIILGFRHLFGGKMWNDG